MHRYPIWNCDKKIESREQSIIIAYRKFFKKQSILKNKQYWTMSGLYANYKNNPIKGEFHQIEEAGLIKDYQFNGVDINKETIDANKKFYPNLNWHHGDFLEVMKDSFINNNFNPAIINCDNVRLPKNGSLYLISLLMFIDNCINDELMVVSNLMLNNPYVKGIISPGEEILNFLLDGYDIPVHWKIHPYYYKYHGSGIQAKTWMGTILFIKQKHTKIEYSNNKNSIFE